MRLRCDCCGRFLKKNSTNCPKCGEINSVEQESTQIGNWWTGQNTEYYRQNFINSNFYSNPQFEEPLENYRITISQEEYLNFERLFGSLNEESIHNLLPGRYRNRRIHSMDTNINIDPNAYSLININITFRPVENPPIRMGHEVIMDRDVNATELARFLSGSFIDVQR